METLIASALNSESFFSVHDSQSCNGQLYCQNLGVMTNEREVTSKDFQMLMAKRRRSVDDLVDIFRGQLDDDTRSFFECLCPASDFLAESSPSGTVIAARVCSDFVTRMGSPFLDVAAEVPSGIEIGEFERIATLLQKSYTSAELFLAQRVVS